MNTSIQEPVVEETPFFVDNQADNEARRWVWSGSITEVLPKGSGHDYIYRRTLLPIDSHASRVPLELPAMWLNADGTEEVIINSFGTQLINVVEPPPKNAPFGSAPKRGSGVRATASQLVHDIVYSMNSIRDRGIGEVKCLRGKFEKGSATEPLSLLSSIEDAVLPGAIRITLRKTLDWLTGDDSTESIELMVQPEYQALAFQLREELTALAMAAELFISSEIDTAEAEKAEREAGGKGQKRLTAFNHECLRELERVEAKLIPGQQGIATTKALGREMAEGMSVGMAAGIEAAVKAAIHGREDSAIQQENDELRKRLEKLELKLDGRRKQEVA